MTLPYELVQRLEASKGDTRAQSVVAAEFVLMTLPEVHRKRLRALMDAASVLRRFDASTLGKVLEIQKEEALNRLDDLRTNMPFVERDSGREGELFNIHESTRLGWRKQLADGTPERFRILSARAAACFAHE